MTNNKEETPSTSNYEYTAEEKYQPKTKELEICPYPYIPSDNLIEAVNLAIKLERPLLLEGEPGCGKTRLAGAVAYEFTQKYLKHSNGRRFKDENGKEKWWDYYTWNIKSTTRARDGLYRYDAVARLRDAQLMGTNPDKLQDFIGEEETEKLKERLKDKKNYLEFGALGKALGGEKKILGKEKKEHDYRPILLIDEIDKADSDFANDLLLELEELRFEVPETGEEIEPPTHKPIIFITSNREKPLPEPFLRRCIYFHVDFPNEQLLENIINKRFGSLQKNKETLVEKAIEIFYEIRESLENNPGSKPPGTSEFIDFIQALLDGKDESKDLTKKELDKKKENLNNLYEKTPLLGILLKSKPDYDLIVEKLKKGDNQ